MIGHKKSTSVKGALNDSFIRLFYSEVTDEILF